MYNEEKCLWVVVDGDISEIEVPVTKVKKHSDNITKLYDENLDIWHIEDLSIHVVFKKLAKVARKSMSYTVEMDRKLMGRVF
jgi:hypothetical protein